MANLKRQQEIALKNSKNFCMAPWLHLHLWPEGKTFPCCVYDSEQELGSFNKEGLASLWNSSGLKSLRRKMLKDKESPGCARCYELEKNGVGTLRQLLNQEFGAGHWDKVLATRFDGHVKDQNMVYLDIRFSNKCNLKCRSCGPELSSAWLTDEMALTGSKRFPNVITVDRPNDLWTELSPLLDTVEMVNFAGGEPLFEETHYKLLEYWIKSGQRPKLSYFTNFSLLQHGKWSLLDLWQEFPEVKLHASLDAFGERGEYMRKGLSWDKVEKNHALLKEKAPHVDFSIAPAISLYNIFHMPDFIEKWIGEGKIVPSQIVVNMVTNPSFLDVRLLSPEKKQECQKKYDQSFKRLIENEKLASSEEKVLEKVYSSITQFLNQKTDWSETESEALINNFLNHTFKLDSLRGENFKETFPELRFLTERAIEEKAWSELWS